MRTARRVWALGIFLALLLAAASAGVYLQPKARWRAEVWVSKVAGELPDATWGDVAAATAPHRVAKWLSFSALAVSIEKQAEAPCPVQWKTRWGAFWGRSNDADALQVALKYRVLDEVYLRGPAAIRPGDVVIDGGSHLGTFTRFALDRGARLVVAFEPDPTCAACFRKTFREQIAQGRVILVQEALWEKSGQLRFLEGESSVGGTILAENHVQSERRGLIEVRATKLDEAAAKLNLEQVDFVKLNIEGSERQALAGARKILLRFRPRLLVNLIHRDGDPVVIPQLVREIVPAYKVRMRGLEQACFYMN